jgi:hypothetical protein
VTAQVTGGFQLGFGTRGSGFGGRLRRGLVARGASGGDASSHADTRQG